MRWLLVLSWLVACTPDPNTLDQDGDGYAGKVDCDDFDAAVNPDAGESCNGRDDDCDGTVDNGAGTTWYLDGDGDGWGVGEGVVACDPPAGHVPSGGDCDDADGRFHPGASEPDCADPADYNCDGSVGFADADKDGFPACKECDDADAARNPGKTEVCNEVDDNCNGVVDLDAEDAPTWFADVDGDGQGGSRVSVVACEGPPGFVADSSDCDDLDATIYLGAKELCDGRDGDCDGAVPADEVDGDADGYLACEDCNDRNAEARPGAVEVCDKVDNDCDGAVDEAAVDARTWYSDKDADGYGDDAATTRACEATKGQVGRGGDCDDTRASVRPGADEVCGGGDEDCDGSIDEASAVDAALWYRDADGDLFGARGVSIRSCKAPAGYVASDADCNDASASVKPGATETCNGLDDDCDAVVDEDDASDATTWHLDADGDGFGGSKVSLKKCTAPPGYVGSSTDCDDTDKRAFPGGTEVCGGGDEDCDGFTDEAGAAGETTYYADLDEDGYGDSTSSTRACTLPSGYATNRDDCDDAEASTYPGAPEVCDGEDHDCDGDPGEDELRGADKTCPGLDCADILDVRSGLKDGSYWIDPASTGAFLAWCDMSTAGGGWTRVSNIPLATSSGCVISASALGDPAVTGSCNKYSDALINTLGRDKIFWAKVGSYAPTFTKYSGSIAYNGAPSKVIQGDALSVVESATPSYTPGYGGWLFFHQQNWYQSDRCLGTTAATSRLSLEYITSSGNLYACSGACSTDCPTNIRGVTAEVYIK